MRILGIDPGIGRTGWGLVEVENARLKVQSFGCVETKSDLTISERLRQIYTEISKIIAKHKPDEFAIEELFFNTNAKTALIVGHARGVALLLAGQKQLSVSEYTPLQVKIALTGYGRAEKNQIGQMVKIILGLQMIPKPDDAADALAIAITHAFSRKMNSLQ